ncbi:MAG TPA: tripartite tricarboxylate transporter substrate-binding protein [Alphaproteobacteria bacterium]|nr:tripartite tricarboxylate transporter substrate-binding protein [Alphaproteobacteria bacterium]
MMIRKCFCAFALAVAALAASPASAQDAAAFFKGKTLTFITPGSPGGGYDTYMRSIIPHLEKKTGVTVVPVNDGGGGHRLAVNKTYSAKPDGLTILLADGEATLVGQLLNVPGSRYDLLKMNWLGRANGEKRLILFTKKSPYKSIKEAKAGSKPFKVGAVGKTDSVALASTLAAHALGLNIKMVIGYKGSREFVRAAIQGEVDAIALSESSSKRFSKGGRLLPQLTLARERSELFPKIPTAFEEFKLDKEAAFWLDFNSAFAEVGRAIVTTPKVPADRLAYRRKVFAEILTDKSFQAEMAKKRRPISYADHKALEKSVNTVLGALDDKRKKQVRHIILEKYY